MSSKKILCLFDVDGTLTKPRQVIEADMEQFLETLKTHASVGLVGGSDLVKIAEQMKGMSVLDKYENVFSENGLVAHKYGEEVHRQSIANHIGEANLQKLINFSLRYMSELELPVKRGTFVEFRSGLINLCPVGRSCSQAERDQFAEYDKEHQLRSKFRAALIENFGHLGLRFVIGGQISLDAFPEGWDKTYCLRFVENAGFDEIHFFGDKTSEGGNDYEIFLDSRTIGHTVVSPEDTRKQVKELLNF